MRHVPRIVTLAAVSIGMAALTHAVSAFRLNDHQPPSGAIVMEMRLGASGGLSGESASWNECATAALGEWNTHLRATDRIFRAVSAEVRTPALGDAVNSVFWSDGVFGTPLGAHTLAVTSSLVRTDHGVDRTTEVDVIVNTTQRFDCYADGVLQEGDHAWDLKRVTLHAFGHVLGLAHADEATPPHRVDPIMSSVIGATDTLQVDDIQGALTLLDVPVAVIPLPPRDEALDFFLRLENEYRDTLERQRDNQGFVNAEGSAVWFPEWLRYVLNECSATEATNRVLMQIRGQGVQPVCGMVAPGVIEFPPRDQSLDFLNTLDAFYRDELNRAVELSYINLEGKAIWLQEYLRYRVNGCNDTQATERVLQQIRGYVRVSQMA